MFKFLAGVGVGVYITCKYLNLDPEKPFITIIREPSAKKDEE